MLSIKGKADKRKYLDAMTVIGGAFNFLLGILDQPAYPLSPHSLVQIPNFNFKDFKAPVKATNQKMLSLFWLKFLQIVIQMFKNIWRAIGKEVMTFIVRNKAIKKNC